MPTHNRTLRRCPIFILALVFFLAPTLNEQEDKPHFGSGIVLTLQRAALSPQGNYAASAWQRENEVVISLWDMRRFAADGTPTRAEADHNTSLSYTPEPELYSRVFIEFSPDERYLAVRKDHDITILTVPDLAVYEVMSLPAETSIFWDEIAWSPDDNLLAVEMDTADLLVWDVENNQEYYYEWINFHGPIIGTRDGWLLWNYYDYPYEWAFMACERLTESCTGYAWDEIPVSDGEPFGLVFSPIGEMVLATWLGEEDITNWAWRRQPNGSYLLDDESLTALGPQGPQVFSPDGRYLVTTESTYEITEKAASRVIEWQRYFNILDSETLNPLHTIDLGDTICELAFFPNNSEYFVTDCHDDTLLRVYQIGEDEPLDVVDMHAIASVDTADFFGEYYESRPEEIAISQDGRWVSTNFGYGKLFVPVIFSG